MRLLNVKQVAVVTALGLSACAVVPVATQQELEADRMADARAEAGVRDYHRNQHRGGLMQFVAMSLDTLGTSDAARPQVEALQRDLYGCMAPSGQLHRQLRLTVADGVAAGAVDLARVDGIIVQMDAAAGEVRTCSVTALNQLHAVLSLAERSELTEKVQAQWEVWREVNDEAEPSGRGAGSRLAELTAEVSLTPDQVNQASAALHVALSSRSARFDRARVDADVQSFSAAFAAASFDAKLTIPQVRNGLPAHGATRMAIFYETVTPLLTPAQRAELAAHLRARAGQSPAVSIN
jgi:hypothetical protein